MYKSITDRRYIMHKILFLQYSFCLFLITVFSFSGCDGMENSDPNVKVRFFHSPYHYPTGGISHYLTHGDFNRDGAPDIAVTNYDTNNVAVLLRNSEKGNFNLHVDYQVGKGPGMIISIDIDGDGYDDLAVVNQNGNSVSLLYGKGDGTFEEAETIPLREGAKPLALAFSDIKKDGYVDMIIAESGMGEVGYTLNNGNRTWTEIHYVKCGDTPRWLLPVDLDKNGEVDLVVSNRDSNNISVFLSQPDNPFSVKNDYNVGTYPRCVDSMDINGDTYLDLVVANAGSGNYSLLIYDNGGFTSAGTIQSCALPMKFLLEDLNEDGYIDLVGLLYGELTLSTGASAIGPLASAEIFYGNQSGTFVYQKTINLGIGAIDIDKVDLNADTHKDLVFTLSGLNRIGVIYGDGKTFNKIETRPLFDGDIGTMSFGDFDGNSSNEIVVCSNRNANFRVFQVNTNLSLVEKSKTDVTGIVQFIVCTPIDKNNNSVDLVFCERGVMGVTVYLNNGQGLFQKKGTYSVKEPSFSHSPYPSSIAVGDVNNDGNKDIVTANPGADTISVLLGDGTGAFGSAKETIVGNYPMAVKLADVNRDGKLDLLFVSSKDPDDPNDQAPSRFVCWFGKGDGTFDKGTQKRYATNGNPRGLLLVDLDRDGDLEAVTVHPTGQTVVIFGAKPDGTFVNTGDIKIGKNPKSVFSWDIDSNGFTDLISINGDSTISVVLNKGNLQFSSAYFYYAGHSPISGIPFDIDKDGIYDLIFANNASNDISFVMGRNP